MVTLWQRIRRQQPQVEEQKLNWIDDSALKVNPNFAALTDIYGGAPQPQLMPKNYKAYAQEGYRTEATIYKCISYIARNGAAIPPVLYADESREKIIEKHPLLDRLNRPNPEMSGIAYREACIAFLLIAGNSYQYAIRSRGKPPDELWPLRADYVQIIPSKERGIVGYYYRPADRVYDALDIGHMKYWCPDDDLYGLSPMEVSALLVDQQTAARKWNLALLQNWARLPGAWVVPTPLGRNERERLEQKLKEKMSGFRNAGTPPVLDAGMKWESMGVPPAQMDWIGGMQFNAGAIANIYNIPPMVVGDTTAMTFDNMKQAEVFSYTEGIFPDLDKMYALWNMWLLPMYPDLKNAYLYYDKQSVEVIQEVIQAQKDAQSRRATRMWLAGEATLNESRILQGLPPVKYGNVYRIQNVLIKDTDMLKYAEQSLTVPAAAPLPQHEPILPNAPGQKPLGGASAQPDSNNQGQGTRQRGKPLNEPSTTREPLPTTASRTEKTAPPDDNLDEWLEQQFEPSGQRSEYRSFIDHYSLTSGGT